MTNMNPSNILEGNIKACVEHVHDNFQYRTDKYKYFDFYNIMKMDGGKFTGDCEDFSLTVLWFYYGQSWWKFILNVLILHRSFLWHARTSTGGGHAIGYCDGVYFDNWSRVTYPSKKVMRMSLGHKFIIPLFAPLTWIYFISGWIFKSR